MVIVLKCPGGECPTFGCSFRSEPNRSPIVTDRDVVLGTCTCTRVVLEYHFKVLVLVLVLVT